MPSPTPATESFTAPSSAPSSVGSYDLELDSVVKRVKEKNHRRVLLLVPDGLKIHTKAMVDELRGRTKADIIVWMGSNYGACDIPLGINQLKVDLVVGFGHNAFIKDSKGW